MSCVTRRCLLRRHTDHRTTYQQFGPAWSTRTVEEDPGAPFFNETPIYRDPDIRRLRHPDRPRLAARDRAGPLRPAFDCSLAVGAGQRLFPGSDRKTTLSLAGSEAFDSGVLHLTCTPASPTATTD